MLPDDVNAQRHRSDVMSVRNVASNASFPGWIGHAVGLKRKGATTEHEGRSKRSPPASNFVGLR